MYAPGAKAPPPKVLNFLLELNTLHRLLHATLTPRIGDCSASLSMSGTLLSTISRRRGALCSTICFKRLSTSQGQLSIVVGMPHKL
jgi:hypothetical protein